MVGRLSGIRIQIGLHSVLPYGIHTKNSNLCYPLNILDVLTKQTSVIRLRIYIKQVRNISVRSEVSLRRYEHQEISLCRREYFRKYCCWEDSLAAAWFLVAPHLHKLWGPLYIYLRDVCVRTSGAGK